MGFPAPLPLFTIHTHWFQSLVGVYGFSRINQGSKKELINVSIPSRGLWVFPLRH